MPLTIRNCHIYINISLFQTINFNLFNLNAKCLHGFKDQFLLLMMILPFSLNFLQNHPSLLILLKVHLCSRVFSIP